MSLHYALAMITTEIWKSKKVLKRRGPGLKSPFLFVREISISYYEKSYKGNKIMKKLIIFGSITLAGLTASLVAAINKIKKSNKIIEGLKDQVGHLEIKIKAIEATEKEIREIDRMNGIRKMFIGTDGCYHVEGC